MKTIPNLLFAGCWWSVLVNSQGASYWDYGFSPPVYPTPQGSGTDDWAGAYSQARSLVGQMTVEEKVLLTTGIQEGSDPTILVGCVGFIKGVPRLGFPGMCFQDAGNGVRSTDGVSAYPAGITGAASWNRSGNYDRGYYMGKEFKARNLNTLLGPVISPMGRVVLGGRVWEGFGPDPYLSGELAAENVRGIQQSVIACVKHYIGNEQETNRAPGPVGNESVSANIDDKTMHELYLFPFQSAVHAGAGSIMCSYNRVNNSHSCQNSKLQNGLLKGELGYQGFVISDWGATYTQTASVNAGLDIAMPAPAGYAGNITEAVANGTVSQARLDDMATRILASYFRFAPFLTPGYGQPFAPIPGYDNFPYIDARDPASKSTLFQGAVEGIVLVKNTKNILPLKAPRVLSLFGYDAPAPPVFAASLADYIKWALGYESVNVTNSQYAEFFNSGIVDPANVPSIAFNGTLISGGGSGSNTPAYISSPFDAFSQQAWIDNTWVNWDFIIQNPTPDARADACIVFINAWASESYDRNSLSDEYSDTLVENVAASCPNTIVVIHNAGIRLVDAFYNNPNVTAILYAHLPGQDSGRALVEVMYGNQSPSGRLPYTVAMREEDYGGLLNPTRADATSNGYTQSNFTEGVYTDYKYFIENDITPRFDFGFGLTYTTFGYSGLEIFTTSSLTALPGDACIISGGNPYLFDIIATVNCTVTNTGNYTASEVSQLYVGVPGGPKKVLRGFEKTNLAAGQSQQVSFPLTRRDLSSWDVVQQEWALQSGTYQIYVGESVNMTPLQRGVVLL